MNRNFFASRCYKEILAAFEEYCREAPASFKVFLELTKRANASANTVQVYPKTFADELGTTVSELVGHLVDLTVMNIISCDDATVPNDRWTITLLVH